MKKFLVKTKTEAIERAYLLLVLNENTLYMSITKPVLAKVRQCVLLKFCLFSDKSHPDILFR